MLNGKIEAGWRNLDIAPPNGPIEWVEWMKRQNRRADKTERAVWQPVHAERQGIKDN